MSTVEVAVDLPFCLRVQGPLIVPYDEVCQEAHVAELAGHNLEITFSRRDAGQIDNLSWPQVLYERTTVRIRVETATRLSTDGVGTFAIRNCLAILNRVIASYQATTMEVSNAGFIVPLGTSDMQLFAEIRVDGKDIRDRYPGQSINTFPLSAENAQAFQRYVTGAEALPLSRLFLVNAYLSLERGQYSLAVLQAATAVELKVTMIVSESLKTVGWSDQAIRPYERMTLGQKLQIPGTDPRSLETYFSDVSGFANAYEQVRDDLTPLRNRIAHQGYLASHEEALRAMKETRQLLKLVG